MFFTVLCSKHGERSRRLLVLRCILLSLKSGWGEEEEEAGREVQKTWRQKIRRIPISSEANKHSHLLEAEKNEPLITLDLNSKIYAEQISHCTLKTQYTVLSKEENLQERQKKRTPKTSKK